MDVNSSKPLVIKKLAGIEYHGSSGITKRCLRAIARILQFDEKVERAYLLSSINGEGGCGTHCYLLEMEFGDFIAIKSGFSSGYNGQGPSGLSTSLQMLIRHEVEIEELNVDDDFINRIDSSCLLRADLKIIKEKQWIGDRNVYDYIKLPDDMYDYNDYLVRSEFPNVIPFSIIDLRIMDLAIKFKENPDWCLSSGYRRLEDIVRARCSFEDVSGSKLFSQAFNGSNAKLKWPDRTQSEVVGGVNLFTGAYMAYRNSRAHKETDVSYGFCVKEFLILNQLFVLESESELVEVPVDVE